MIDPREQAAIDKLGLEMSAAWDREMAKQIGPVAKREAIAAIIRACHRSYKEWDKPDGETIHAGEYEAADKILDLDADDHK